nr:hypothetical protein [Tanacetum cinerariifolium]GFB66119.1 hypothetical protein [Tanacetum cinerariifolium]
GDGGSGVSGDGGSGVSGEGVRWSRWWGQKRGVVAGGVAWCRRLGSVAATAAWQRLVGCGVGAAREGKLHR